MSVVGGESEPFWQNGSIAVMLVPTHSFIRQEGKCTAQQGPISISSLRKGLSRLTKVELTKLYSEIKAQVGQRWKHAALVFLYECSTCL